MVGGGEAGDEVHGVPWVSNGTQPWGPGCLHGSQGRASLPRGMPSPKTQPAVGSSAPRSVQPGHNPSALRFLEGEASSEGTDPASHALGLGLHFPEAGDRGEAKISR